MSASAERALTPELAAALEAVRDGLRCARSDNQLLDGRDFDGAFWDTKDVALATLREALERGARIERAAGHLFAIVPERPAVEYEGGEA